MWVVFKPPDIFFPPRLNFSALPAQELVARLRPTPQPVHETLFHVAAAMQARRRERQAAQEAALLQVCEWGVGPGRFQGMAGQEAALLQVHSICAHAMIHSTLSV